MSFGKRKEAAQHVGGTPGKYVIDISVGDGEGSEFHLNVRLSRVLTPDAHKHLMEYVEMISDIIRPYAQEEEERSFE